MQNLQLNATNSSKQAVKQHRYSAAAVKQGLFCLPRKLPAQALAISRFVTLAPLVAEHDSQNALSRIDYSNTGLTLHHEGKSHYVTWQALSQLFSQYFPRLQNQASLLMDSRMLVLLALSQLDTVSAQMSYQFDAPQCNSSSDDDIFLIMFMAVWGAIVILALLIPPLVNCCPGFCVSIANCFSGMRQCIQDYRREQREKREKEIGEQRELLPRPKSEQLPNVGSTDAALEAQIEQAKDQEEQASAGCLGRFMRR